MPLDCDKLQQKREAAIAYLRQRGKWVFSFHHTRARHQRMMDTPAEDRSRVFNVRPIRQSS